MPDEFALTYGEGSLDSAAGIPLLNFDSSYIAGTLTWFLAPREVRVLDEDRAPRGWHERQRAVAPLFTSIDDAARDRARETGVFVDPVSGQTWYSPVQVLTVFGAGGGGVAGILLMLYLRRKKTQEVDNES